MQDSSANSRRVRYLFCAVMQNRHRGSRASTAFHASASTSRTNSGVRYGVPSGRIRSAFFDQDATGLGHSSSELNGAETLYRRCPTLDFNEVRSEEHTSELQ